jgi:hypothetical protein
MTDTRKTSWLKLHAAAEKRLEKALLSYFDDQRKRIVNSLKDAAGDASVVPPMVSLAFDQQAEHEKLIEAIHEPLEQTITVGAAAVEKEAEKKRKAREGKKAASFASFALSAATRAAIKLALADLEAKDYWREIQAGTESHLVEIIEAGIVDGLTPYELTKQISESLGDIAKWRSKAVARTETTAAFNAGHQASYSGLAEEGLISGKRWLAIVDGDTRQDHLDVNGVVVGANDTFEVGGESANYPGDANLSGKQRISCRCTTEAVFSDEDLG